jgi:hypothetical protein
MIAKVHRPHAANEQILRWSQFAQFNVYSESAFARKDCKLKIIWPGSAGNAGASKGNPTDKLTVRSARHWGATWGDNLVVMFYAEAGAKP